MTPVHFTFPLTIEKFAVSGQEGGGRFLRGHAAVFGRKSHDLGGFRTEIAPSAFASVLDTAPDVHLVWDHDTRYVLARTTNKTLELREDPYGLHVWASLAPTSYADDLAVLMERGDVDQMSFACDIGADTWTQTGEGDDAEITRTITEVSGLYDVTVCAQGAFPQTNSQLQADLASAIEAGRVQMERADGAAQHDEDADTAAPEAGDGVEVAPQEGAGDLIAAKHDVRRRVAKFQHPTHKEDNQ
jgi:HK97 family phage prohead protease